MSDVQHPQSHETTPHTSTIPNAAAIAGDLAEAIAFGQPWIVQDRRHSGTAVAVKKCGGREDEIVWDYTFADGSGDYCNPDAFIDRFTPVAPMVPLTTTPPPQLSGTRADEVQIALWIALATPLEVHGPASAYTRIEELIEQLDDRADAFLDVLAALIAERTTTSTDDRP